jgi:hypothetical protein
MGVLTMCCNGRWGGTVGQWSSSDCNEQIWRSVVLNDVVHNAVRREMRRREDVEA